MAVRRATRSYECVLIDINTQTDFCEPTGACPVANVEALLFALHLLDFLKTPHAVVGFFLCKLVLLAFLTKRFVEVVASRANLLLLLQARHPQLDFLLLRVVLSGGEFAFEFALLAFVGLLFVSEELLPRAFTGVVILNALDLDSP